MNDHYHKNKDKHISRSATGNIINGRGYNKYNPMKMECSCGSKENLEVHHEVYPKSSKDIKKAMDERKIYYKCRKCHGRRKSHTQMNNDNGGDTNGRHGTRYDRRIGYDSSPGTSSEQ